MIGLVLTGPFHFFLFNITISCMRTFWLNSQGLTES